MTDCNNDNDEEELINQHQEGMALMAAMAKKMILELLKQPITSEAVIANTIMYLDDFYKICPEFANEFFNDMDMADGKEWEDDV